jgi:CheY-like chemotaxis protein
MVTELHFLVVGDEPNLRCLLIALFKDIGFLRVSEAANGEMALRALKTTMVVIRPSRDLNATTTCRVRLRMP